MSSTYGESIKLSIFGQSHGPAIGMTLDGVPAGLPVNMDTLQQFLNRRAPGQHCYDTPRKEEDTPEFLAGIVNGYTCGAPVAAVIKNENTKSGDYANLKTCPRPGHADYTAQVKFKGFQDYTGGGHFSGRLTAPLCVAGGLCLQWLELKGIKIGAHIRSIGEVQDLPVTLDPVAPDLDSICNEFPVINLSAGAQMREAIEKAKADGDSLGGVVECFVTGLPAGLGGAMFGGLESKIAQVIYGIPAVKGIEFGSGFAGSSLLGSQNNDSFSVDGDKIFTLTNHAGGILGGISTGMPVVFSVAIKPTPSIAKKQQTVDLKTGLPVSLQIHGRHDPCIVPRVVPVIEAATAIALFDTILGQKGESIWI